MRNPNLMLLPCSSASDFFKKYRRRLGLKRFSTWCRRFFIAALTFYILVGLSSPTAQTSIVTDMSADIHALRMIMNHRDEMVTDHIIDLSEVIRYASDWRLGEREAMRYAGLIYHGCQMFNQDPLDIVALVVAESSFYEGSINEESGDFGLGQINWHYWGRPNGLTPQDLLDPAINIVMTCRILDHYGGDFAKYHRGYGIKSEAYSVNIRSILYSLKAYAKGLRGVHIAKDIKSS